MSRIRKLLLCLVLGGGSLLGVPMRPGQIEELLRTMNEPKVVRTFADEAEANDP